jgi:hypothetical protein
MKMCGEELLSVETNSSLAEGDAPGLSYSFLAITSLDHSYASWSFDPLIDKFYRGKS